MGRNQEQNENFAESLRTLVAPLCKIQPGKINTVNIRANYGNYRITIRKQEMHEHHVSLEINGQIHHLFLTPGRIAPNLTNLQIEKNMKDTVIMRDLAVHLIDINGNGTDLSPGNGKHAVEARELINLAGRRGEELIEEAHAEGKLSKAAYDIIRNDILAALTDHPEDSLEEVTEF